VTTRALDPGAELQIAGGIQRVAEIDLDHRQLHGSRAIVWRRLSELYVVSLCMHESPARDAQSASYL
jgi:hypothetical protein